MRPKVVIFTLVAAFGLLGIMAVLKGVAGKRAGDSGGGTAGSATNVDSASASTSPQDTQRVTKVVVSEQLRAAVIEKEIEQIRNLMAQLDGTNNAVIIAALLDKATHAEADVRKAAVQALKEMNDTNAIPGLEKLEDKLQDPREKVAVMDVIDFLKLPNLTPDVQPPETLTNMFSSEPAPPDKMNQAFLHDAPKSPSPRHIRQRNNSPGQPAGQPPAQPQ